MKNRKMNKKIKMVASVVALTTLAPLANPVIPTISWGGGENRALAAETGKNVNDKVDVITSESSIALDKFSLSFSIKDRISAGDYIEFEIKNMRGYKGLYGDVDVYLTGSQDSVGKVRAIETFSTLQKSLYEPNFDIRNNLKKEFMNAKIRVTFDKNIEAGSKFNIASSGQYDQLTAFVNDADVEIAMIYNGEKKLSEIYHHTKTTQDFVTPRGIHGTVFININNERIEPNVFEWFIPEMKNLFKSGDVLSIKFEKGSGYSFTPNKNGVYNGVDYLRTIQSSPDFIPNLNDIFVLKKGGDLTPTKYEVLNVTDKQIDIKIIDPASINRLNEFLGKKIVFDNKEQVLADINKRNTSDKRMFTILKNNEVIQKIPYGVNIVGVNASLEGKTVDDLYNLKIKYIDIDTNEEIFPTKSSIVFDSAYNIRKETIKDYDFVESTHSLSGNLSGDTTITLKYRKQSKSINVKIVDENGKELKSPITITKKIGEDYIIEKPNIPNYVFKEVKDNKPLTGKITDNDEVVLVYKLNKHNVTVKYIHRGQTGEVEIKSPFTKEYTVGDPLNIETPKINGYKYKESSEPINGKVGDEDKVIKLYYSKYIPGPQGDKGTQGDKGISGDKGDKGGKGIEGTPGREGHTPDIRIDPKSGNWIVDGEDTGFRAIVFDGKDGKDGKDGNIDYNKVKIHYITSTGEIAKPTETVDKNKVEDKLKDENTIVAKEKDNSIIAVVPENNKESDNNRKEKEPLIKYNIISDKGEELTSSVYLPKGKDLPNITIPGYKLLKTEKLSDTETRVIYSKDNSTPTKVELNNDITYRLVDENNKPISTVKYQDDKFQPKLEGYKFKEKKVISEKEIVLVYQKDNSSNNPSNNKIAEKQNNNSKESKDNTINPEKDNSNTSKQSNKSEDITSSNNSIDKNGKIKSIIKTDAGEILETLYLDKDAKPEIKGYKYKETKVVDENTQELIYTSESPNLRKADVKSGIDGVSSTTVGLFASILAAISAIVYRKRKE